MVHIQMPSLLVPLYFLPLEIDMSYCFFLFHVLVHGKKVILFFSPLSIRVSAIPRCYNFSLTRNSLLSHLIFLPYALKFFSPIESWMQHPKIEERKIREGSCIVSPHIGSIALSKQVKKRMLWSLPLSRAIMVFRQRHKSTATMWFHGLTLVVDASSSMLFLHCIR